jgi:type IV pilus assembly protein PilM
MGKNIIGLDISDASIEAVVLQKKYNGWLIKNYSRFRLSPEVIESGQIIDKEKLKDSLVKLFKNAQPGAIEGNKKVFLSLPESKVFSNVLSLSKNLKDKDLREAIYHKIEESVPEALDNLVIDFKELPASNNFKEVFYSAAELNIINSFLKVFQELNIEVLGITSEAFSSLAGLADKFKRKTSLLLDVGAKTTIVSVFDTTGLRYTTNINIAGDNITDALAKKLEISQVAAEEAKIKYGLVASEADGQIMLVIQGQLQPLTDELKKFISYYEESFGRKIEQVVLVGGSAQIKGLDKYFTANLNLETYVGEAFLESRLLPTPLASPKYINALGLAKLGFIKAEINFYESLLKNKKTRIAKESEFREDTFTDREGSTANKKIKPLLILLGVILLVVAGFGFIFRQRVVDLFNLYFKKPVVSEVINNTNIGNIEEPVKKINISEIDITSLPLAVVSSSSRLSERGVLGEYFFVTIDGQIAKTSIAYEEAMNSLLLDLQNRATNDLNTKYKKEGWVIVPELLDTQIVKITPATEAGFKVGDPLALQIKIRYLAYSLNDLKALFAKKFPNVIISEEWFTKLTIKVTKKTQFDNNYDLELILQFPK